MQPRLPLPVAVARLVTAVDGRPRRYRPLIAGPAVLEQPLGARSWTVAIACERRLMPRPPLGVPGGRDPARSGAFRRIGIALVSPLDAAEPAVDRETPPPEPTPPLRLDVYGWALMYQPPGLRGRAVVDGHERFADLPAVFERPLELIARAELLESRGVRTRPLLIPVLTADFVTGPDGRPQNRFLPDAAFRHPSPLDGPP